MNEVDCLAIMRDIENMSARYYEEPNLLTHLYELHKLRDRNLSWELQGMLWERPDRPRLMLLFEAL